MGRIDILPGGDVGLDSVADIQRRSLWTRIGLMGLTSAMLAHFVPWPWALGWYTLYLAVQVCSLASGALLARGGLAPKVSLSAATCANYIVMSAPAWSLWHQGAALGGALATLLICGLLVRLIVYSMGHVLLFWLCAAPLAAQLILLPLIFSGAARLGEGLCGAACGVLVTIYFAVLWRTWRQSLLRIEEGQRAALAKSAEADRANAAKSDFLATMSHEIRTPLNGMLGMVQALVKTPLAPAQREMVATIDDAGLCLLAVLDGVLDISKLDSGHIELDPVPFRLDQMLTRAAALFRGAAESKGLILKVALDPACARTLVGDDTRLRQIVVNLLSNAVKFTSAGEVGLSANLTEVDGRADLTILVRDTGDGMSHDVQERLFHRFEQGDSSTTRRFGGTGLGLAIAHDLAELMGGGIEVRSRPGEGAEFRVTLSLPFGEAAPDARAGPIPVTSSPNTAVRILAAEDNPTNQLVLRTLLGQLDITLTLVDNGAQALACRREGEFDIILMDLHMPVMDGLTAARAIRRHEADNRLIPTPMIALTADAMTDTVARCLEAGMNGHVAKPIRLDTLLDAIDAALAAADAATGSADAETAAA